MFKKVAFSPAHPARAKARAFPVARPQLARTPLEAFFNIRKTLC